MALISLRRASAHRRRRHNPRFGLHRPSLRYTKRGWKRSKRSRLMKHPVRINPALFGNPFGRKRRVRRSRRALRVNPFTPFTARLASRKRWGGRRKVRRNPRRAYRRYARHNPPKFLKALTSKHVLMTGASIGGGIIAGYLTFPVIYNMLPAEVKAQRNWLGLINVGVGALMYAFLRKPILKNAGLAIAATGVIDIIVKNVPQLGLEQLALPETSVLSTMMPQATGASFESAILPSSPMAQNLAASYSAPGFVMAGLGSDNPYRDIEGFGE